MKTITIDILRVAFRKLLTATYYDKTDLVMRYRVATFARNLSSEEEERRIFDELLSVAEGKNDKLSNILIISLYLCNLK